MVLSRMQFYHGIIAMILKQDRVIHVYCIEYNFHHKKVDKLAFLRICLQSKKGDKLPLFLCFETSRTFKGYSL
ncbi:hypothetical protein CN563_18995 [Bacillus sp. AFS026049]|jgi:hypothetical protein|nr:hypothetical protein CON84_13410 [Bacillus sp. AFS094228]PEO44802.1 hypothetical protein CN563_18995 [Bacillus sp. AFS026049]